MLEGEKGQHSLEIVHVMTDLLVVDPTKIDEGKDKVGCDRKKFRRRAKELGEPRREGPGDHPVIEEDRQKGTRLMPLIQIPDPQSAKITGDLKMGTGIGGAFVLYDQIGSGPPDCRTGPRRRGP